LAAINYRKDGQFPYYQLVSSEWLDILTRFTHALGFSHQARPDNFSTRSRHASSAGQRLSLSEAWRNHLTASLIGSHFISGQFRFSICHIDRNNISQQ
jgi:hypothetical protein